MFLTEQRVLFQGSKDKILDILVSVQKAGKRPIPSLVEVSIFIVSFLSDKQEEKYS